MKRQGYVSSTPIHLPPLGAPAPGSLDAQLREARLLVARVAALPRTDQTRQQAIVAAVAGAEAFQLDQSLETNPYPVDSVDAAAWLLGWWTRSREEQ